MKRSIESLLTRIRYSTDVSPKSTDEGKTITVN